MRSAFVAEQQRIALREIACVCRALLDVAPAPGTNCCPMPAEMPFETIVLLVFFPMWIIFVPVSACC